MKKFNAFPAWVYRASEVDAEIAKLREQVEALKKKLHDTEEYVRSSGGSIDGYVKALATQRERAEWAEKVLVLARETSDFDEQNAAWALKTAVETHDK